jgi:hypothetical protein
MSLFEGDCRELLAEYDKLKTKFESDPINREFEQEYYKKLRTGVFNRLREVNGVQYLFKRLSQDVVTRISKHSNEPNNYYMESTIGKTKEEIVVAKIFVVIMNESFMNSHISNFFSKGLELFSPTEDCVKISGMAQSIIENMLIQYLYENVKTEIRRNYSVELLSDNPAHQSAARKGGAKKKCVRKSAKKSRKPNRKSGRKSRKH